MIGLPYSAHPISWYRPKFTGIHKHQTSSYQTSELEGKKKKYISTNDPFTSGKCWLRIKALFTWRNYSYQTFLLPLYCVCAGWAGLSQRCIGTGWESEKPDLEEILIWIPSEMEKKKSQMTMYFCCCWCSNWFQNIWYQKKDSSGILWKNVEWNPALDGTTTAQPQVPIAYFLPLLSSYN